MKDQLLAAGLLLALASCATAPPSGTTSSPGGTATPPEATPTEPVPRDPVLADAPVQTGLQIPWDLAFAPDGRMFVTERAGRVLIFESGEPNAARLATRRLQHPLRPRREALGDHGRREHVTARPGPASLNGKVLRVEPDGSVPADSPVLPGTGVPSLVFTWGHRNPQGIAFQPGTGMPFLVEHGPDADDEINVLRGGANYGWPVVTGADPERRFADPAWASGNPTLATAGGTSWPARTGERGPGRSSSRR